MAAIFRCRETNETQKVELIQQRVLLASLEKAFKAAEVKIYEEDDDDEPTSVAVDNNGFTCGQFVNNTTYDVYVEKAAEIAEMRASHATTIVNAAGSSKTGYFLVPKDAASTQQEEIRLYLGKSCPTQEECLILINKHSTLDLSLFVTEFQTINGYIIPAALWQAFVADKSCIKAEVVTYEPKAHTSMTMADAKLLLTGDARAEEIVEDFSKSWLIEEQSSSQVLDTCSDFLSLQSKLANPSASKKDSSQRGFISPALVAAGTIADEIELLPEVPAICPASHGVNDWEFLVESSPVAVIEAKVHQPADYKAELFSGMAASRHQFCRDKFGNAKESMKTMDQIPVCGVLTNALEYQLFRFDPVRNPGIITTSQVLNVPLKARMTPDEARVAIKEIVAILVQLLVDQKKGYRDFWREHKKNASRPNSARQTSRAGSRFKLKGAPLMKRQDYVILIVLLGDFRNLSAKG